MVVIQNITSMDLLVEDELLSDSATFTVSDIPDDRKYYLVVFSVASDTNNTSSRITINGLSTDEYSRRNVSIGSADQSANSEAQIFSGNKTGTLVKDTVNGYAFISRMANLDKISVFLETIIENGNEVTQVPDAVIMRSTITDTDNFSEISFFFSAGNVSAGSYCDVYGSKSRM